MEWNRVVAVAAQHGVTVTADRPPRPAADPPFVLLRDYVWSAGKTGLWGDDRHLPLTDLDAPELGAYEAARTLCACPLCPRLRPDPDVEAAMVARMSADDAWYLSRTERKSAGAGGHRAGGAALEALIRKCGAESTDDLLWELSQL